MKKYDIVKVKHLDYSKVALPTDVEKKKEAENLIKKLEKLEGELFLVNQVSEIDDEVTLSLMNDSHQKFKVKDEDYDIILLENEVELLDTDYLNNCCIEELASRFSHDNALTTVCSKCGFSPRHYLNNLKSQETKTK